MTDRNALLRRFVDAALALMSEGLAGLEPRKAHLVDRAQQAGADVCLVFSPGAGSIVAALHSPDPAVDPVELFRIEAVTSGASH